MLAAAALTMFGCDKGGDTEKASLTETTYADFHERAVAAEANESPIKQDSTMKLQGSFDELTIDYNGKVNDFPASGISFLMRMGFTLPSASKIIDNPSLHYYYGSYYKVVCDDYESHYDNTCAELCYGKGTYNGSTFDFILEYTY